MSTKSIPGEKHFHVSKKVDLNKNLCHNIHWYYGIFYFGKEGEREKYMLLYKKETEWERMSGRE